MSRSPFLLLLLLAPVAACVAAAPVPSGSGPVRDAPAARDSAPAPRMDARAAAAAYRWLDLRRGVKASRS